MDIPDTVNKEAYLEFLEFRKLEKKNPVGKMGAKKHFKLLSQYSFEIQEQMLDASMVGGWTGIFPIKQFGVVRNDTSQEDLRLKQLAKIAKQSEELKQAKAVNPVNNVMQLKSVLIGKNNLN